MSHEHKPKWFQLHMPNGTEDGATGYRFDLCECGHTRRLNVTRFDGSQIADPSAEYSTDWTARPKVTISDKWPTWKETYAIDRKGTA